MGHCNNVSRVMVILSSKFQRIKDMIDLVEFAEVFMVRYSFKPSFLRCEFDNNLILVLSVN